mmetsp:Transcript_400/g.656  ORF Transcript_400/g.656 Transcript_400/m.656 type:complete len:676 (+) Transcript_400:86-2113(+)
MLTFLQCVHLPHKQQSVIDATSRVNTTSSRSMRSALFGTILPTASRQIAKNHDNQSETFVVIAQQRRSSSGDNRPSSGSNRRSAGNNRQSAGNNRQSAGSNRQSAGNNRSSAGNNRQSAGNNRPYSAVLVVPDEFGSSQRRNARTGLIRAFADSVDWLVSNSTAIPRTERFLPIKNLLPVDDFTLTQFSGGRWGLRPVYQNRVGVVIDKAIEPDLRFRLLEVIDSAKTVSGVEVPGYVETDSILEIDYSRPADVVDTHGTQHNVIANPGSLLRASEKLMSSANIDAVAVLSRFPDVAEAISHVDTMTARGLNPFAAADVAVSCLLSNELRLPSLHVACMSGLYQPPPQQEEEAPEPQSRRGMAPRRPTQRRSSRHNVIDHALFSLDLLETTLLHLNCLPQYVVPEMSEQMVTDVQERKMSAEEMMAVVTAVFRPGDVFANCIDSVIVPKSYLFRLGLEYFINDPQVKVIVVEDEMGDPNRTRNLSSITNIDESSQSDNADGKAIPAHVYRARTYYEALQMIIAHRSGKGLYTGQQGQGSTSSSGRHSPSPTYANPGSPSYVPPGRRSFYERVASGAVGPRFGVGGAVGAGPVGAGGMDAYGDDYYSDPQVLDEVARYDEPYDSYAFLDDCAREDTWWRTYSGVRWNRYTEMRSMDPRNNLPPTGRAARRKWYPYL